MLSVRGVGATALCAVLTLAACSGDDDDGAATAGTGGEGASGALVFHSNDDFKFDPTSASIKAGDVTIEHVNDGGTPHTFVIEDTDFKIADDGEDDIELEAGEYTFYCDVPGHRDAGMEGTLTVTP